MIPKRPLLNQLRKLDRLYNTALQGSDFELPKYYSRLAVLEIGGWVEECMENIVWCFPKRKRIREQSSIDYVKDTINNKSGFSFDKNFRWNLKHIVGIVTVERVEHRIDPAKKQALESALTHLYPERCDHAHKPLRICTKFTAPSVCIALFNDIFEGLKEYEKYLKRV